MNLSQDNSQTRNLLSPSRNLVLIVVVAAVISPAVVAQTGVTNTQLGSATKSVDPVDRRVGAVNERGIRQEPPRTRRLTSSKWGPEAGALKKSSGVSTVTASQAPFSPKPSPKSGTLSTSGIVLQESTTGSNQQAFGNGRVTTPHSSVRPVKKKHQREYVFDRRQRGGQSMGSRMKALKSDTGLQRKKSRP